MFIQSVGDSDDGSRSRRQYHARHDQTRRDETDNAGRPAPDAKPEKARNISFALGVADTSKAEFFAALSVGCAIIMPLKKPYWAKGFGTLIDKFDIKRMINCEAPR
ncbi:hypothetical protein F183_A11010 [Bryobacterales bacterium F-183]|nr:hypothetical protein F183_A11010 [Bryobacterales bacterium F-183]